MGLLFLFADHALDTDRRELHRGSESVAVEPQVFDLLLYLLRNRDRVVTKDDLIASVWGGRIVSESTLTSRINAARKAIGDSGEEQKLIRTIARKGLRFVGDVRVESRSDEMAANNVRRRLTTILAADVAGYSRLTGADEEGTVGRLRTIRSELVDPAMAANRGRFVKATGDGVLIEFASVVDAVRCAMDVQQKMATLNADYVADKHIEFRIGIHLGDVIVENDGDLMGDGVNIAARLEGIAEPGGICLSEDAYRQVRDRLRDEFTDLGEQHLKNIARPVRAYRWEVGGKPAAARGKRQLRDKPSIAVLPFVNMSGEPEQEYFSDGISEDIITALSKLRWFFVIARNSSFIYKGKAVHMNQIAEELGVDYVVEGSVRKGGDRVRITAQLNDVATGSHIWAVRYDRSLADVFAVQDEITEAIVAAIEPQLYAAENFRAQRKPPDSMDAWDLVMRALSHFWRVTRQDNVVAQALLEKAIAIDPHYGQALGVLATSHAFGAHMGWEDMATAMPVAKRAAEAAIQADSEDPWAHAALGSVNLFLQGFENSLAEFELALRLNPNFSLAQAYYGLALSYCGRWEEANEAARRALQLSPRDPFSAVYAGIAAYAQFVGRNYDEAMRLARESIRQRGDFVGAHRVLTAAAGMAGQTEVAATALRELRRAQPGISLAWIANQMPIQDDTEREHYLEGFRRAGLA
ncbi:MAG TPA: winged helix-turn-helix domain-containing protein [Stellaceae bacterium]|nr:winged helix-turn-helix domain-containing protein [Stellaceae bacterium]